MRGNILAVIYLLGLLFWIQDVAGGRIERRPPGGNCKCRKVTSEPIKKSMIWRVKINKPINCPVAEIIIKTKTNRYICVDPDAKWFENMFPHIIRANKDILAKPEQNLDQNNSNISSTSQK